MLTALLAGCTAACATVGTVERGSSAQSILVRNQSSHDVVVYVVRGAYPVRLGRILSHSVGELPVHQSTASEPLQLVLRMSGSGQSYRPEPVWLRGDARVVLTIAPLLTTSYLTPR